MQSTMGPQGGSQAEPGSEGVYPLPGMGPIKGSPWFAFAAWFDSQDCWSPLQLPQRLVERRSKYQPAPVVQWEGEQWGVVLPRKASGEDDIRFSAEIMGGNQTNCYCFELEDRVLIAFCGSSNMQHLVADLRFGQVEVCASLPEAGAGELVHEGFNEVVEPSQFRGGTVS